MSPDVYEFLEAEGYTHAIRLKINAVLQESIAHLLSRPVDRPPNLVRRVHASFSYQAGSWERKRRVVAKVEWHPGELYPRVGFNETHRLKNQCRRRQKIGGRSKSHVARRDRFPMVDQGGKGLEN